MAGAYGTYEVFIDWDDDEGLNAYDFETGLQDWYAIGTTPPTVAQSASAAYNGSYSMQIDWVAFNPFTFNDANAGFDSGRFGTAEFGNPDLVFTFNDGARGFDTGRFGYSSITDPTVDSPKVCVMRDKFIVGRTYTLTARVLTNSSPGAMQVRFEIDEITGAESSYTSVVGSWQKVTLNFTATKTTHTICITPQSDPAGGERTFIDAITIDGFGEDITSRVLSKRSQVKWSKGRDQSRALSPINVGEIGYEVLNTDGRYSPDNPASPIARYLKPGRRSLFRVTYGASNQVYNLFHSFIDGYEIDPETKKQSVSFTAQDALGRLGDITISTEVFKGKRTGELIGKVLDAAGWPEDMRIIDSGATVVRYWWEEDTDAMAAIQRLVDSEGAPSYVGVDPQGRFIFKDRHHRLLENNTVQATFYPEGTEPSYSAPFLYDLGWKDVINHASFVVEERQPDPAREKKDDYSISIFPAVWKTEDTFTLAAGETREFVASANNPVINAQTPQANVFSGELIEMNDYKVLSGTVQVSLNRTSGKTITIRVHALTGPATVQGMKLRAQEIPVTNNIMVQAEDSTSVQENGRKTYTGADPVWAGPNDAAAIATQIVGIRSTRLPTLSFTLNNGHEDRFLQILQRDLSDRIHISESQSGVDHDFHIESISHTVSEAGKYHEATFGCEKAAGQVTGGNVFTFNDNTKGFDTGRFGYDGISDPDTVFILDQSNLNEGLLGF